MEPITYKIVNDCKIKCESENAELDNIENTLIDESEKSKIRWKKFDYELIIDALKLFEERLDLAKYITEFNGENGFMFTSSPEINDIGNNLKSSHSGASFALTLRKCQSMIKNELQKID